MGTQLQCGVINMSTPSNLTTLTLERDKLKRAKYALLARVGQRKREASAYQEAEEHYFTIATEQHAVLAELLDFLQLMAEKHEPLREMVSESTSQVHDLTSRLLHFWPRNSDSQERVLSLLDSGGLGNMLGSTPEGFVALSSDLILENVARAIGATKDGHQNPLSD